MTTDALGKKPGMRTTLIGPSFSFALFVVTLGLAGAAEPIPSVFVESVRRDTEWLAGYPTRVVGTRAHDEAGAELLKRVKAIPGVQVRTHEFEVVVPETLKAELTLPDGRKHPVHPFWPASSRLNTTPKEGISGRLVYIGEGRAGRPPGHLPARSVRGQIAVMEMTGGKRWMDAFNAGARAIVVLGSPEAAYNDAGSHLIGIPINVPRFFVPDGKLARSLRGGELTEGTLYCGARWAAKTARNIYALITAPSPAEKVENRQAFVLGVHYDSMSVVPAAAPGADAAVDVAVALNVLRHAAQHPPKRPLLVAFTDAYATNQVGIREMLGAFATLPEDRKAHLKDDLALAKDYREHEALASEIDAAYEEALAKAAGRLDAAGIGLAKKLARRGAMSRLHEFRYRDLRRYLKDEVAREVVAIETVMYPKRGEMSRTQRKLTVARREIAELEKKAKDAAGRGKAELDRKIAGLLSEVRQISLRAYGLRDEANDLATRRTRYYGAQRRLHTSAPLKDIDSFTLADKSELTEEGFQAIRAAKEVFNAFTLADGEKVTPGDLDDVATGKKKLESLELAGGTRLTEQNVKDLAAAQKTLASFVLDTGKVFSDDDLNAIVSSRIADELWQLARARISGQLAALEQVLARYEEQDKARLEMLEMLGLAGETGRPLGFVFGLDLSGAGVAAGPCLQGSFVNRNETRDAESLKSWIKLRNQQAGGNFWPGHLRAAVNLAPFTGTESVGADIVGRIANYSACAPSFATGSMTWSTLDAERVYVDTPNDRADRLDWGRLGPQVEAALFLLTHLLEDMRFVPLTKVTPHWSRVRGNVVDQSPGEPVPRVPMQDYLVALVPGGTGGGTTNIYFAPVPGVRRQEFALTRIDGRFRFDLIPAAVWWPWYVVQPAKIAEDGRVVRTVDLLKGGRGATLATNIHNRNPGQLRAVVFDCVEITGLDFFDPRFLMVLPAGSVQDARRGSAPQRLNYTRQGGHMVAHVESDVRWQLLMRHGITTNRLALLNMTDPNEPGAAGLTMRESMTGFSAQEQLPVHPTLQGARDFYRLDWKRIEKYKTAGISSEHIENLQRRTKAFFDAAAAAADSDDGKAYAHAATGALANEVRVYQAVRDTANDVVRGAIFLLLMIVPFSFVIERLIFATPSIYKQIGAIIGVFALMAGALWSFHPAFRITGQPLMIIMAFGAIGMSVMVMSMLFSKFETLLEELRSGRAEASGARTSRMGLAYTAIRLGIANMRKRKLRTALTGITVVLITFALLCFMSAGKYQDKKEMSRAEEAPFAGVLVAQRSSREMPEEALENLRNVVPEGRAVVPHYWWVNVDAQWRLHVRAVEGGKQISLKGALGVVGEEAGLSGIDKLCGNWPRFGEGEGCYLAADSAKRLGVEPGDRVVVAGRALELLGTYDAKKFDDTIKRLDGEAITPFDFTQLDDKQRGRVTRSDMREMTAEIESGAALGTPEDAPHASSDEIAIVHASLLRGLDGASLRHISVKVDSHKEAQELAADLSRRLAFPIYYGSPGQGVTVIASTPLVPQPPKKLLIPLIIAGLIIFNTMLSSIAERKSEIYIYTSLGLAPLHVGFLFLAEAITYGLMGSIFGYVVGQGVAKAFTSMGFMTGITLNYSGGQAIVTMLMVIGVVIVSSIVPAYLAGKLATPSNEMTWKVPQPEGDVIRDRLPFTATGRTAGGVLEFLYEYMDAHKEGTIGVFSADDLEKFHRARDDGRETYGVHGTVWLAPYDLGVRQEVTITIHATTEADIYEIDIELLRRSGQVSSWWKLNRVLLGDLRRQLLGWRKLKIDRMLEYITRAAETGTPLQTA
ncbi:MAG: FtsX-like permease family protein [Planctomycetota bacterium]